MPPAPCKLTAHGRLSTGVAARLAKPPTAERVSRFRASGWGIWALGLERFRASELVCTYENLFRLLAPELL